MAACLLGAPPKTLGFQVSRWESKWMTESGTVGFVDASQQGEGDGMVTAEGNDSREGLA